MIILSYVIIIHNGADSLSDFVNFTKTVRNRTYVDLTSVSPAKINHKDGIGTFIKSQIRSALHHNNVNRTITKRNLTFVRFYFTLDKQLKQK